MDIKAEVREYILENHLPRAQAAGFTDATPLVTSGVIDSIGALALISFIEDRFSLEFLPREIDLRSLETVESIERAVRKKLAT